MQLRFGCGGAFGSHQRFDAIDDRSDSFEVFNVFIGIVRNFDAKTVFNVKNDHCKIEGYVNQKSSQSEILQAVNLCLQLLEDEFEDGLHLTEKDWVRLEEVVAL